MEFYEVLDKIVEVLRSRGRVTYGALLCHAEPRRTRRTTTTCCGVLRVLRGSA